MTFAAKSCLFHHFLSPFTPRPSFLLQKRPISHSVCPESCAAVTMAFPRWQSFLISTYLHLAHYRLITALDLVFQHSK